MDQIEKITNVVKPDFKIFVGDSLAGNDTVNQAKEFHEHTKFDAAILTKSDADARGGAALSIVKITSAPVIYVGVGQEYEDIKSFDKELFLETIFGKIEDVESVPTEEETSEEPTQEIEPEPEPEPEPQTSEVQTEAQTTEEPTKVQDIKQESVDDGDPFEGIDDKDISLFADLYDEPPPENDQQAKELAAKIRKWIANGKPKPD